MWDNSAGFFSINSRPFHVRQSEFVGTGIMSVDYEFTNE